MDRHIIQVVLLSYFLPIYEGKIAYCNATFTQDVCKIDIDYDKKSPADPLPQKVNITFQFTEKVLAMDHEGNTLTFFFKIYIMWADPRITSKEGVTSQLELSDTEDIWSPEMSFANAIYIKELKIFGGAKSDAKSFWYVHPGVLYFSQILAVTFSCIGEYQDYPFDNHRCNFEMKAWTGNSKMAYYSEPVFEIYENSSLTYPNIMILQDQGLGYDFTIKSAGAFISQGRPVARIEIQFRRNQGGINRLLANFYIPSGIFSLLSLLSFSIEPNQVPGRMGLLLTLDLIAFNTYNSLDAPLNRGFSYVEVWFTGVQAPMIYAILEYGAILSVKKYGWLEKYPKMINIIDTISFFSCSTFLAFFVSFYWYLSYAE